jgi:hypothetical protein
MNIARIESHPGLFGNPYMDTKLKTHEANPQKGFVVQINASENFGLETQSNLSKDHQEAVSAFAAKRRPNFTGG